MRKILSLLFAFICPFLFAVTFNNSHLEQISEWFQLKGQSVKGYWVYANKVDGSYKTVEAVGEGSFCVDDVARVVLLYSEAYEQTKDESYLKLSEDASLFVRAMQAEDGEFYNFAFADGTVNEYGVTSKKSTSWWALRAFWALSKLASITKDTEIIEAAQKAYRAISQNPPQVGDQLSIYLLALCEYDNVEDVRSVINQVAQELLQFQKQSGVFKHFFSVYRNRFTWHGWGNRYAEALIEAYKKLGTKEYLDAALKSIKVQSVILCSSGFLYAIENRVQPFPELSYAVEPIVVSCVKAYEETLDDRYALMAAIAGSWYFGGNRLGEKMYGDNGEGYDGLEYMHVNKNAGAESTVCALRSVLYLNKLPRQMRELCFNGPRLATEGLVILEVEGADVGISDVILKVGDYAAGAAYEFHNKARFKWPDFSDEGNYMAMLSGNFSKTKITLRSGDSIISAQVDGEGVFELGEITLNQKVILTLNGQGVVDQLILMPVCLGISTEFDGGKSVVYCFKDHEEFVQGLNVVETCLFKREEKGTAKTIEISWIQQEKYCLLDIRDLFNCNGIASPADPGNFDNLGGIVGAYLPDDEVTEGIQMVKGIPFDLEISGFDNLRAAGQTLLLPETLNVDKIHLLAAANHGDYDVALLLGDQSEVVTIEDWCKDTKDLSFEYRYTASGLRQYIPCGIEVYSLNVAKTIEKLVLPKNLNVHIFAITLELK
ncbi:MAG: hypothetical protein J7J68_06710 [Thermotogaceae bacterium]|nr:hypothetical protein [Thermotogaceae bacterium]